MKTLLFLVILLSVAAVPLDCMAQRARPQRPSDSERATWLEASIAKETAAFTAIGENDRVTALEAVLMDDSYGDTVQERLRKARDQRLVRQFAQSGYTAKIADGLWRLDYPLMDVFSGTDPRITPAHTKAFYSERIVIATVLRRYPEDRSDGLRTTAILQVDETIAGQDIAVDHLILRIFSGPNPDGTSVHRTGDPELVIAERYLMFLSHGRYVLAKHDQDGLSGSRSDQLVMTTYPPVSIDDLDAEELQIYRKVGQLRSQALQEGKVR